MQAFPEFRKCFARTVSLSLLGLWMCGSLASAAIVADSAVFVGGAEGSLGTPNYRIPGMTVAPDGSVLAFAEGRRSNADPGAAGFPIDMVYKRSTDNGQTWSPLGVLQANAAFDYDDPAPVVDFLTGAVHLIHASTPDNRGLSSVPAGVGTDSMSIWQLTSLDNGVTWSAPLNITAQVKNPVYRGIVPGPGSGIQLRWQTNPARNGRLVIPGSLNAAENYVFYSDDHGSTWQAGGVADGPDGNENEVVELTNGDLLMNARQNSGSLRRTFRSQDGGATWLPHVAGDIAMTTVDASLIRYSAARDGHDRDRLLFAAPLGPGRTEMAVWTSYDEGQSFINPVVLASGHAGYSVLSRLQNGHVGLLYEATGNSYIRFLNFDLPQLELANHLPDTTHYDGFGNSVNALRGGMGWSGAWSNVTGVDIVNSGGLEFGTFQVEGQSQHAQIRGGGMQRELTTPIALDQDQDYYLSLFVRSDNDGSDSGSQEFLDIDLRANGVDMFTFGVTSSERLILQNQTAGTQVTTADDAIATDQTRLLLAKIAARGSGVGQFDQIFLASFADGDAIPTDPEQINWQLVGSISDNFTTTIDSIAFSAGTNVDWSIDELRVGTSLAGVIVDNGLTGVDGDINQDGIVDGEDVDVFVSRWLTSGYSGIYDKITNGDLTLDGQVNLSDVFRLHQALLNSNGSGFPFARLAESQVPEPNSLALLAGCVVATRLLTGLRWGCVSKR